MNYKWQFQSSWNEFRIFSSRKLKTFNTPTFDGLQQIINILIYSVLMEKILKCKHPVFFYHFQCFFNNITLIFGVIYFMKNKITNSSIKTVIFKRQIDMNIFGKLFYPEHPQLVYFFHSFYLKQFI